jgi:ABC-type glycerol-3-phosphate transport system substrate-binding protein
MSYLFLKEVAFMKATKRGLFLVILSCLLAALAWAGGGDEVGDGEADGVVINVQTLAGPINEQWQQWKRLYEADNPNVTIEISSTDVDTILNLTGTLLAEGEEVDISFYWAGQTINDWGAQGILLDLSEWADADNWNEKRVPTASGFGDYTFCIDFVTMALNYYNPAIFEEAGVEVPTTLEENYAVAEAIKEAGYIPHALGGGNVGYGTNMWFMELLRGYMPFEELNRFVSFDLNPNEADLELFRSDAVYKAFAEWKRYLDNDLYQLGMNATDDAGARNLFTAGQAAIYRGGSWALGQIATEAPDLDFDYFYTPGYQGEESILGAWNAVCVSAKVSDEKKAVIRDLFNKILTETEYANVPIVIGDLPVSVNADPALVEGIHPLYARLAAEANEMMVTLGNWDTLRGARFKQIGFDAHQAFLNGQMTAEEAVDAMYEGAKRVLEESR